MGTWTFGYDGLNRITGATNTSAGITGSILSPQTYCYDSFGNRWPGTVSNAACVPGGANTFAPNNQVQPGFAYDLAGNVIANQNFGLGTDTYTWDSENRLQSVNASTFYQYDAEGRRVAKGTVSSSGVFTPTAEYLYGDDTATELDGSGNWKRTDVNAAGRLLATYNPAGLHYQLADWLGTRRVQTTAAGVPEETCISYPFGDGPTCSGTDATGSRYTGKERDSESGLDYFGARYYGSNMGRWISPDIVNVTEDRMMNPTNTLNKYSYGANNPLKYIDSDGKDITIFYHPADAGLPGHIMLLAYDQNTGDSAIRSFGPVKGGIFDNPITGTPGTDTFDFEKFKSPYDIRSQFGSITIQTTPEEAQTVIQEIRTHPDGRYDAFSHSCTTTCRDLLHKIGKISTNQNSPAGFFYELMRKYGYGFPSAKAQGTTYGPLRPGYDPFTLFFLTMKGDQTKGTVTTNQQDSKNGVPIPSPPHP